MESGRRGVKGARVHQADTMQGRMALGTRQVPVTAVRTEVRRPKQLRWWIPEVEKFLGHCFGWSVSLQARFSIPDDFLDRTSIPVYDSGSVSVQNLIELLQDNCRISVRQIGKVPAMAFAGSERSNARPRLILLPDKPDPDQKTLDRCPSSLMIRPDEYLTFRAGLIAAAMYSYVKGVPMSVAESCTWFPASVYAGGVAFIRTPNRNVIEYGWRSHDEPRSRDGARRVIELRQA